MRYGNQKIYHIEEIDFSLNPNSQFDYDKIKGKISYKDYYKTKYLVDVKN